MHLKPASVASNEQKQDLKFQATFSIIVGLSNFKVYIELVSEWPRVFDIIHDARNADMEIEILETCHFHNSIFSETRTPDAWILTPDARRQSTVRRRTP